MAKQSQSKAQPQFKLTPIQKLNILFINKQTMRVSHPRKPQKAIHKHNNYTQGNSPNQRDQKQMYKKIYSTQLTMPQVTKIIDYHNLGNIIKKPIKSLKNSKDKYLDSKNNIKMPIFDINLLKNSLNNMEKQDSARKIKKFPISHRIITDKKYHSSQHYQKQLLNKINKTQRLIAQTKIKFRLTNKIKQNQKTEQPSTKKDTKNSNTPEKYQQQYHKIITFPQNQIPKLDINGKQQNYKSLEKYHKKLTQFQKQQIIHHQIHYISQRRIYSLTDFTDTQGDPKIQLHDHVAYRYQIISQLGRGSFGRVYKAFDHKKKQHLALKLIKSQKKFQQQAKVQISILQTVILKDPKFICNVVRMKCSFVFRGHTCITFEILHKNLYEFLKENHFSGFSHKLIRRFAIQILQTLCFFKKYRIIHCDLKPQNILLKQQNKTGIRVIDVGSGCFQDKQIYTYIQSRFYRAPQIIFGIKYTTAIDMWSFGCIMVQLFTGFPIFPGQSQNQQVLLFLQVLGYPPEKMLEKAVRRKNFFDDEYKCKIPQEKGQQKTISSLTIEDIVGSTDSSFIDFIRKCLEWDPNRRLTPAEALMHQWILKGLPQDIREQHIEQVKKQYYQY